MKAKHYETQFLLVILILAAALAFFVFLPELNVIVLGMSLAILFQPWYVWMKKTLHGKDSFAAALVVIAAIIIILVPLIFFGFQIFLEAQGLYSYLASGHGAPALNVFIQLVHDLAPSLNIDLTAYIQQALGLLLSNIGPIFSGVFGAVGVLLLSFFAFYYFLKDGSKFLPRLTGGNFLSQEHIDGVIEKLHDMATSVIRGSLVVSIFYGVLVGIGFFIFGLPSAILWGGVTVVASFIPVFGVMLVAVPGIVYLAALGNTISAVGLLAWTFVMSAFMENFLRPRLLGHRAKIHPLVMMLAVLGGLSFFGPIGILLGPLVVSLLLTLLEIYPSISA